MIITSEMFWPLKIARADHLDVLMGDQMKQLMTNSDIYLLVTQTDSPS